MHYNVESCVIYVSNQLTFIVLKTKRDMKEAWLKDCYTVISFQLNYILDNVISDSYTPPVNRTARPWLSHHAEHGHTKLRACLILTA